MDSEWTRLLSQFVPITPEKTTKPVFGHELPMQVLRIDEMSAIREAEEREMLCNQLNNLQEKENMSHLCSQTSLQLPENHKPDKDGTEEAELSKTPQQKPKKKRHRPKVITEGKFRKTSMSDPRNASVSMENKGDKRKYVRKKGINNLTASLAEEEKSENDINKESSCSRDNSGPKRKYVRKKGIDQSKTAKFHEETTNATESNSFEYRRMSCRKSLNFDLEVQEKYERFSCYPKSNFDIESQSVSFNVEARLREADKCRQGMELLEKNVTGVAYRPACSMNQALNNHLFMSERCVPRLPHATKDPPQYGHVSADQSASARGKCKIIFSDMTQHNKGANFFQEVVNPYCQQTTEGSNFFQEVVNSYCQQTTEGANFFQKVVNPYCQQTTENSTDSNRRSSLCLFPEVQVNGFKRQNMVTAAEAENHSRNVVGTFYNSLQTYSSIFAQNSDNNGSTTGMHFPVFYKKMRTDSGQNTATSPWQSRMTEIGKHVNLDTCGYSSVAQGNPATNNSQDEHKNLGQTGFGPIDWMKKEMLKAPDRVLDLASQWEIYKEKTASPRKGATFVRNDQSFGIPLRAETRIEAPQVDAPAPTSETKKVKKQSKRSVNVNSIMQNMNSNDRFSAQLKVDAPAPAPETKKVKKQSKGSVHVNSIMQNMNSNGRFSAQLKAPAPETKKVKKQSKRSVHVNSIMQNMNSKDRFTTQLTGSPVALNWRYTSPVDELSEKLNQLDLNVDTNRVIAREPTFSVHHNYQEQHALVPYQNEGAIVPCNSQFDLVTRRKPRPKVELDDETTRVWKLLLENINSEGIDGTDDEKAKWWEEERRVFNGRADSFIARMHLVQGDRRFSPWKGSVLDSVIGVFLTQNVSDHLSSSAFMSLAARFPPKSNTDSTGLPDKSDADPTGLNEVRLEPKLKKSMASYVMHNDQNSGLNEVLDVPTYSEDSKTLHGFNCREIRMMDNVRSSENSSDGNIQENYLEENGADIYKHGSVVRHLSTANNSITVTQDKIDIDDSLSSQASVISSQNSAASPTIQNTDASLPSSIEEEPAVGTMQNRFSGPTSFVKLLQMAETVLHGVYEERMDMSGRYELNQPKHFPFDLNREVQCEECTIPIQDVQCDNCRTPAESIISCSESTLHVASTSGVRASEYFDLLQTESTNFDTFSWQGLCATDANGLQTSPESDFQNTFQMPTAARLEEEPRLSNPSARSSKNNQTELNGRIIENQKGQVTAKISVQENSCSIQSSITTVYPQKFMDAADSISNTENLRNLEPKEINLNKSDRQYPPSMDNAIKEQAGRIGKGKQDSIDWDCLRKQTQSGGRKRERTANTMDSVDWDAVKLADVNEIAHTIRERGMNNMLAARIKDFLDRLVREHESLDLEWLRDVPPDKAKEYLLSVRGLGLKSVECVRLLTLHHLAFPVDTNVGRIAVRLGWVPLQPLPESLQLHLLELYPVLESIQKYLWPRLCKLDQRTLYELHYQLITFGKVFCTKSKPNCNACPMRGECRHFASAFASARLALPAPDEKSFMSLAGNKEACHSPLKILTSMQFPVPETNRVDSKCEVNRCQPIIEEPASPEPNVEVPATPELGYRQILECDIESISYEDPDEIPTIQLNMEEFTHNLQKIMEQNVEILEGDASKAIVALTPEAALIPMPKLKNVSQLRTEHHVYELPDSHPLLEGMDKREPDDPCPYLLAIWTPGETVNSIEAPERQCSSQEPEKLCNSEMCLSCNSIREANSLTVRGTLLIPCRTAMRGSFPLNGTYFQVNEVFSDHESSLDPMNIPRKWLWNLPRRTVYFGTSIPTIFKGLSTEGIQYCFWRGFVCVRGFDRKTRAPRPLIARLHFPASKLGKGKGNTNDN